MDSSVYLGFVSAGFPSPAAEWRERKLNLHDLLVPRSVPSYFARVAGNSMDGACIHHNDYVIIDRGIEPTDGAIVIVALEGSQDYMIKRLRIRGETTWLVAAHPGYPDIQVTGGCDVFGVVTYVIHEAHAGKEVSGDGEDRA